MIDSLALEYGFGKIDLIDYGLNQYIYKNEEKNNLKENEIIKAKKIYLKIFSIILAQFNAY